MPIGTMEQLEARIVDFWARRHKLAKDEWNEFAKLIFVYLGARNFTHYATLQRYHPMEDYASLKRQFVEDFFTDKIFLPAIAESFKPSGLVSAKVLHGSYYPNYLVEKIRKCKRYEEILEDNEVDNSTEKEAHSPAINETEQPDIGEGTEIGSADHVTRDAGDQLEKVLEKNLASPNNIVEENAEDELQWSGAELVEADKIQAAAMEFLESRDRCDWVLRFLGCHQFLDEEDRPALQWLAKKHGITSYARRAKELGITRPHGGYTRAAPWSDTILGQWLMGVGVDVGQITDPGQSRTHRGDQQISEALKILRCETLRKVAIDKCC